MLRKTRIERHYGSTADSGSFTRLTWQKLKLTSRNLAKREIQFGRELFEDYRPKLPFSFR